MTLAWERITHHGAQLLKLIPEHEHWVGVEVGVGRGRNAATLLARRPNLHLYLVDHWGLDGEWVANTDPSGVEAFREAKETLVFAEGRYRFIISSSLDTAEWVPLDSVGFVFIDADHRYESVLADCRAWWPKVTKFMAGHDYGHKNPEWGVKEAVDEFSEETGVPVRTMDAGVWVMEKA